VDVWVVDNDSVDGSVAFLKENYDWIKLIENKENVGFAKANNQALQNIDAKYVLLLNPDTILSTDTLKKSLDYLNNNVNTGALGVKMIDGDGKFLPESKRAKPSPWNSFCKLSGLSGLFPKSKLFSGYNLGYLSDQENHQIDVLCGAYMMMPTKVLLEVGLLDERFFMYAEDIDLSIRIKEAGYDVVYLAESQIIHYKGESTKKASVSYVKTFYGAMYLYVEKHYSDSNGKFFLYFIKTGILIRAFISLLKRWLLPMVKPVVDIILVYLLLNQVKRYWASVHFGDIDYYANTNIASYLLSYSIIWVLSLLFSGWYQEKAKAKHLVAGIVLGTALILIVYALLPEQLRTSRAIILIGTLMLTFLLAISKWILNNVSRLVFGNKSESSNKTLLVASRGNEYSLTSKIKTDNKKAEIIGLINPENGNNDNYYINELNNIANVCKDLKVDEIVFNSDDMEMSSIIKVMEKLPSGINYRIGGGSHLGLIGSNAKEDNSGLYSLDVKYKISGLIEKRSKRLLDFAVGIIFLVLSPLVSLFTLSFKHLGDAMQLIFGIKTLVGYGGEKQDYQSLPQLKESIYRVKAKSEGQKNANFNYAKYYNVLKDLSIIIHKSNTNER
jgi:GT2 family glycosyltransferase